MTATAFGLGDICKAAPRFHGKPINPLSGMGTGGIPIEPKIVRRVSPEAILARRAQRKKEMAEAPLARRFKE